jgi:tRNA 2-thiouridine synthesizing protein A
VEQAADCRPAGTALNPYDPSASESAATMPEATTDADATLDATGLLCPLPVLKARRALKPLASGAVLEVLATDPGAVKDFEHFCQTTGCELLESSAQPGGVLRFRLRKP